MKKKASRFLFSFLGATIFALVPLTYPQTARETYRQGKACWLNQDYNRAYDILLSYRTENYGRTLAVDYMLATSACRLLNRPGLNAWAGRHFEHIKKSYSLTAGERAVIDSEARACRQFDIASSSHLSSPQGTLGYGGIPASLRGSAKTYYYVDRELPVLNYPPKRVVEIQPEEFEARLIPLDKGADAEPSVQELLHRNRASLGHRYETARITLRTQHFVLCSYVSKHEMNSLQVIGQKLEKYYSFLRTAYEIPEVDYYIVIYLVLSVEDLHQLARSLHGIDVSPLTIGYSFADDMSIVGVIPETRIGTLLHELFHLLSRSHFGDIPQWLDEGMASLYEECDQRGDIFLGLPGWRGEVLNKLWEFKPTLYFLVTSSWDNFDMPSLYERAESSHLAVNMDTESTKKQAAYLAYARYFMLFLQDERKTVAKIYRAFRTNIFADSTAPYEDQAIQLVATAVEDKFNSISRDYEAWLARQIRN